VVAAPTGAATHGPRPGRSNAPPFDQALEALAYVEQGRATGKVVMTRDGRQ
jgi:hypothetical protein